MVVSVICDIHKEFCETFLVAPAESRATYLLIIYSVCMLTCMFDCGQLLQLLTPDGSPGSDFQY